MLYTKNFILINTVYVLHAQFQQCICVDWCLCVLVLKHVCSQWTCCTCRQRRSNFLFPSLSVCPPACLSVVCLPDWLSVRKDSDWSLCCHCFLGCAIRFILTAITQPASCACVSYHSRLVWWPRQRRLVRCTSRWCNSTLYKCCVCVRECSETC